MITFVLDQSIEYGVNMSHKIAEVMAKDNADAEYDEDFDAEEELFDEEDFEEDEFEDEDFEDEDEE